MHCDCRFQAVLAGWAKVAAFVVLTCLCTALPSLSAGPVGDEYPDASLNTCDGEVLKLRDARGPVATVIVCLSIECPISNELLPTIKRVAADYCGRGVRFIGINPNAPETLDAMCRYAHEQKLAFPFVRDDDAKVARQLSFNVTPEVRVFDRSGRIVYRGRIDDRYRAGGGQPGAKTTPELAQALDELIAGKPVSKSRTQPVGCPIQRVVPNEAEN